MQSVKSGTKAPVAIWPDGPPRPLAPYTPAIKAAGWLFVSGQLASDFKSGLAPEAASANPNLGNALELQSRYTLANLAKTIQAGGCDISKDAVRIWQWFTSPHPTMEEFKAGNTWPRISITPYLDTRNEFIKEPRPASTGMGIRELLVKGTIVEVDLICIDDGGKSVGFPDARGRAFAACRLFPRHPPRRLDFHGRRDPGGLDRRLLEPGAHWVSRALSPRRRGSIRISGMGPKSRSRRSMCFGSSPKPPRRPARRSIARSRPMSISAIRAIMLAWRKSGSAGSRIILRRAA